MKLYRINRWDEIFENNRSRSVQSLDWVPIPNKHDGEHYTKVVTSEKGAQIFTAFILMLEVASRCQPRGWLIKDNREPHTAVSLSVKTRASLEWFEEALRYLPKETDWIVVEEFTPDIVVTVSRLSADCQPGVIEGKGREVKGMEGKGRREGNSAGQKPAQPPLPPEAEYWNRYSGNLPKVLGFSHTRHRHLLARRKDPFWVENLEKAIIRCAATPFCLGENNRGWVATFDWLLERSDAVACIMEGKYDGRPKQQNTRPNPRNDGVARSGPSYADLAKEKLRRQDEKR